MYENKTSNNKKTIKKLFKLLDKHTSLPITSQSLCSRNESFLVV